MSLYNFAEFQVGIKAILRKGDEILVLTTGSGRIDFPGGRMDKSEINLPLTDVLKREVKEELGPDAQFSDGRLAFISKRKYQKEGVTHHILAIYYDTQYLGGEIVLSDEHTHVKWAKPSDLFDLKNEFNTIDEYQQFKQYFSSSDA